MEKRHRILVIDDEDSIRYTFESFLLDEGYAVDTAGDFEEALSRINDTAFDLIFADVILPGGKTGIDVIRELRSKNSNSPVVMVTGDPNVVAAHPGMLATSNMTVIPTNLLAIMTCTSFL